MIKLFFEGGLGNQMFQYTFGRYAQLYYKESVEYDISKYKFNTNEIREFELHSFNISKDWKLCSEENSFLKKYGFGFIIYRVLSVPYLLLNRYRVSHNKNTIGDYVFQRLINLFGYFRRYYGEYYDFFPCFSQKKYIMGHWFRKEIVTELDEVVRKELRVVARITESANHYLKQIQNCNSVGVHIRRGDYVRLGMIVCDIDYYVNAMQKLNELEKDLVFFVFSDDIPWVKENLKTDFRVVFVDGNHTAVEDMKLLYSCKHFVMSNSTFSWWGAYLGDYPQKKVITPRYWGKERVKSDLILDEWMDIENY